MGKGLFLFVISFLLGVLNCSAPLMAADNVRPKSPVFTDPLTVEIQEEVKPIEQMTTSSVMAIAAQPTYVAPVYNTPVYTASTYTAPANNIAIAGRMIEVVDVASTTVDAGNHVNRFRGKLLYGHNSAGVFGAIVGLGVGATFSVTTNGVTTNYRVANTVTFEKNTSTGQLQLNGAGSYMNGVAAAYYGGTYYDLALMTCAGTSYGNGDASHRFVIFATAI